MTTHEEFKKRLSPERQKKIKARSAQLLAEELTLKDLRKALRMSQETVADLLGMRQGDLSKFERRSDAYLSTIRRYVEAMGGSLDLVAKFPDREPVHLINIGDLAEHDKNEIEKVKVQRVLATGKKQAARPATAKAKAKSR
jgi:transcriptional regulator with XRE-family HTH domain